MIIILRFDVKPYVGNSISQIYVWDDITAQSHESAIIKHHNPGTCLVNILIFREASRKVSGKVLAKECDANDATLHWNQAEFPP